MINDALLDIASGKIKRLMVFIPPRHGKSMLISQYFPAWYLGMYPEKRIILSSYEFEIAASWGRKAREVFRETGQEFYGLKINDDASANNWWEIKHHNGGMVTAGVRGAITGKGANVLIIDDPVKNAEEARSKLIRDRNWDWFQSTAYTRLEPDGAIILIMSRWHYDDLAGRCLAESEEHWDVINLPAIAVEDENYKYVKRKKGEALWQDRFSLKRLLEIKNEIGNYWFNALYQQSPTEEEGNIFKREYFKYFEEEDDFYVLNDVDRKRYKKYDCITFQTIDLAISEKESADYTVIGTFTVTPKKDLLVLDIYRARIDMPKQRQVIQDLYYKWKPAYIGIENQSYQMALIQELRQMGFPVKELKAIGDKTARALSISTRYGAGTVYHKRGASWINNLEEELLQFPHGEHDDQVDVLSYAGLEVVKMGVPMDDKTKELVRGIRVYE